MGMLQRFPTSDFLRVDALDSSAKSAKQSHKVLVAMRGVPSQAIGEFTANIATGRSESHTDSTAGSSQRASRRMNPAI
jgi:hypothetical protein